MKKNITKARGFTLIELLTALSIFTVVMVISMGSILGVFDANRKSRSLKTVVTNLNLAMENMSKEIKFGDTYHCGSGNLAAPQNCASGGSQLSFLDSEGERITYSLSSGAIVREVGGSNDILYLTAPDATIDSLSFYVLGAGTDNSLQPKVIIKIKAHVGTDKSRTDFTLQTLVSQRELDI